MDAEREERERLGVADSTSDSVWSLSFAVGESEKIPLGVRVFGVGCKLAEVIANLRRHFIAESGDVSAAAEPQLLIERLNRHFANLRAVLLESEISAAESLLEPVVERFCETLETTATWDSNPDSKLRKQCDALSDDLRKLTTPSPTYRYADDEDFDVPF